MLLLMYCLLVDFVLCVYSRLSTLTLVRISLLFFALQVKLSQRF